MLAPIHINTTGIQFQSYPFSPASIYPDGLLPWKDVREIVPDGCPPEIRTRHGEVLFIASNQKEYICTVAGQHHLPCVERVDVWSLLLDPFLDTEFDATTQANVDAILADNGISLQESVAIRDRFARIMHAYNFDTGLWEWVHLSLYDLLLAHTLNWPMKLLTAHRFPTVYWDAMEIAERACMPGQRESRHNVERASSPTDK